MSESIIKALYDWSPWLKGDFPKELAGIARSYDLAPLLQLPEIKILEGARRTGKSTLLYQLIAKLHQENKPTLYINFDDEVLAQHSLSDIYHAYLTVGKIDYLFLDEIQHCAEWVHFVRKLYDTKQIKQLWISGSNASLIKEDFKTLLTGRNITIKIFPLSFNEFLNFKGVHRHGEVLSTSEETVIKSHFTTYLAHGAFPALALRDFYHKEILINYFEDILYKDIVSRYNVNPKKIKDMATYLATNSTKNYSIRKLSASLGLHEKTTSEYISHLNEVFLFSELHRFDYSLKKQMTRSSKIYALDTGIASANAFRFSEDKGRMLENLVHNELKRRKLEVYFHKEKKECDFVIKEGTEITTAIQVTLSLLDEETQRREVLGLEEAMAIYKLRKGIIITADEEGSFECAYGQISIIPAWKWLLHNEAKLG